MISFDGCKYAGFYLKKLIWYVTLDATNASWPWGIGGTGYMFTITVL